MFEALLPRIEGRSRLGQAGEVTYLWLNLMAAALILSVASGALRLGGIGLGDPGLSIRDLLVLWLFGALALRAPACFAWWMEQRRVREPAHAVAEVAPPMPRRGKAPAQAFVPLPVEAPKSASAGAARSRFRERG